MVAFIIATVIILYIILLGFTWHNLDTIENKTKIAYILISMVVLFISTLIIFNISTSGIVYQEEDMVKVMRNVLIAVFVPINGLIVMPYLANMVGKIKYNSITQEQFKKRAIMLLAIFLIVLVIECSYFKNIQLNILNIINQM